MNGCFVDPSKAPSDERLRAALHAPIGDLFHREDTVVHSDDGWYRLLTGSTPLPSVNEVVLSNLCELDPDAHIDAVLAEYRDLALPVKWCVYPWSHPADLGERLLRRGAIAWALRGMSCEASLRFKVCGGARAERVERDGLDAYLSAMARGWELPPEEASFISDRMRDIVARERCALQLFVVRCDGRVAGTASTWLKHGFAHLMGANVLPEFRGRGLYRSLLDARLASLPELGVRWATVRATEHTAAAMLEHLGFNTLFRFVAYQINPRGI